jgi:hypothetical protein
LADPGNVVKRHCAWHRFQETLDWKPLGCHRAVDAQGPATKVQVLKNVSEFKLIDYSMDDLKFVPVSATTGLISYKITDSFRRAEHSVW